MTSCVPSCNTFINCCCNVYDRTDKCRKTMDDLTINFNMLRIQRGKLLVKVERINSQIPKGIDNGMMLDLEVGLWLRLAKERLTEVEGIIGTDVETRLLPAQCPGKCFYINCCSAHTLAKDVVDYLTIVNQLLAGEPENQIFIPDPHADSEGGGDYADDIPVGLIGPFKKAMEYLGQSGFGCLGIHGMGGVGKTQLLTQIHVSLQRNQMEYQKGKIVMVDMTDAFDLPSARHAIGKKLRLFISDQNKVLKVDITRALKNYNFVLLLDDLQISDNKILEHLGIPTKGSMSKVLFTTRDEGACLRMGKKCEKIEMGCLTDDDSWILFQKEVGVETIDSHMDIRGVAQEIYKLCGGMPLALVTIGSAMRGKTTLDEWEDEKNNLFGLDLSSNYNYEKMLKLLDRSYDKLEDTDINPIKRCFLYASLFPRLYLPGQEELVEHWLAEGLLKARETTKDNLAHGRSIISKLRRINLFNHGEGSSTVNLHDMIRAAALSTIKKSCYVRARGESNPSDEPTLVKLPENRDWSQVERISLVGEEISELKANKFSRLSTLFLQKSKFENIPANYFDEMPSLKVLNMSGCEMNVLPGSVTKLTALQYLNVSHTDVSKLPRGFENLKKLKFLNLSHLPNLEKIPSQVIASLSELVKLDLYNSGTRGAKQVEGNVSSEDDTTALIEELNKLKYLHELSLTLKSTSSIQGLLKSKKLLKSLHRVYITMCNDLKTLEVPPFGDVDNLKVLCIKNCSNLVNFTMSTIENMQVVPDPRGGSIPSRRSSFKKLREIEIVNCPGLKHLTWIKYALELQSLKIKTCHELKVVISRISYDSVPGTHQDILSKLKTLCLDDLYLLTCFSHIPLNLSSLEEITVLSCSKMKKLPLLLDNKKMLKSITIDEKAWDALEWDKDDFKETFKKLCKFK